MATTRTRPKLSDLSDEDRAALRGELAAADEKAKTEVALGRADKIADLLRERDHIDGCPVSTGDMPALGRVEAYGATRPANQKTGDPAKPLTIVRCIECGGSTVKPEPFEALMAKLDIEVATDATVEVDDESTDDDTDPDA